MCGITKLLVRGVVVGTVVGGGLLLLASSPRAKALLHQARASITDTIDGAIDDPVALRVKIQRLQSEYPKRIGEVRKDLGEVQAQIAQVGRELAISERVVELAEGDLDNLDRLLAVATDRHEGHSARVVRIRYQDKVMSEPEAIRSARVVQQMRDAYESRAADLRQEQGFLGDQESRLSELLAQLESEHAEFQAQLWQIDRKVDAAARNDRLIAIMKKRQARIDEHSRYDAVSLDDLNRQLDGIRTRQEGELARLAGTSAEQDYKKRAEFEIDRASRGVGRIESKAAAASVVIDLDDTQDVLPLARSGG